MFCFAGQQCSVLEFVILYTYVFLLLADLESVLHMIGAAAECAYVSFCYEIKLEPSGM